MIWFWLLLGLWRDWLGRGIGDGWPIKKGLTQLQYAAGLLLVYLATWHDPWPVTLIDAIGVLALARWYQHGPMLEYPLADDPDGDFILRLVGGAGGGALRYGAYAFVRYVAPAIVWTAALWLVGHYTVGPILGAIGICYCYPVLWQFHDKLPPPGAPGDAAQNWSELVGWVWLGLMMVIV